ncbi:aldo/keto reductase [Mycobacterium shigaense]|uniref:aldo/keto reductase n=1 Tax=Mycobacterium shigaense TaxID=722731 RepID=UPI000E576528|nr:aldo/keto reductase [Mycobacterium shigaense]MEA1120733.1 aldo/keto reductase [Mycobacterium shigaense]
MSTRELGRTGIHVSPIGLGCMQFSASGILSGFFSPMSQQEADVIVKTALDGGITLFDTAELYGRGESERRLAAGLVHAGVAPGQAVVATKWRPIGRTAASVGRTIGDRIAALEPFPIDLHQIHFGFGGLSPVPKQLEAMAQLAQAGKIRSVGVSNFTAKQMASAHALLAQHGIPLASNQVQINLLNRTVEFNGILDTARGLGISLIAYSPLRSGMLTGKFHDNRDLVAAVPRLRRTVHGFTANNLDRTTPLIDAMREIAAAHQATVGQVALAWLITNYGDTVIAIPGASKPHHAAEAAGAMNVALTADETRRLTELAGAIRKRA